MSPIIKVSRVNSLEEINILKEYGVNVITLSIGSDRRSIFNDNRTLNPTKALDIVKHVKNIDIALEFDNLFTFSFFKNYYNPKYLEIDSFYNSIYSSFIDETLDYKRILSRIDVHHDMDASWILARFEDKKIKEDDIFQIDFLTSFENAWNFFKNESWKYEDVLQIKDIYNLSKEKNIIISMNFDEENILSILDEFPNLYGINFTLGELFDSKFCIDTHSFEKIIRILNVIKNK
jgi:hypothetical protein